jgi:peptidoglycan/xylan/chitin deacetylase (PgdA/CDA1 family)
VAVTFDAEHPGRSRCPPGVADAILDLLESEGVPATFFVQGRWASAYPETARRMAAGPGHLVGSHSHYHARMPLLTDDGIRSDLEAAGDRIRSVTGTDPRPWFRCPFGAGSDDPRVLGALADCGYRNVHWNVEAFDWEEDCEAADVVDRVVDGVAAFGDGAVVLLHTWPAPTLEALPTVLDRLRAGGAAFVTVDRVRDAG